MQRGDQRLAENASAKANGGNFDTVTRPSWIQELPDDVLLKIFSCFLGVVLVHGRSVTRQRPLFEGVCSRWRKIILCACHIWSRYDIEVDNPRAIEDYQATLPVLELLLERSGRHPLDLTISIRTAVTSSDQLLSLFCRHADRWQALRLFVYEGHIPKQIVEAGQRSLPLLEYVIINSSEKEHEPLGLFRDAPRLLAIETKTPQQNYQLPIAQLANLHLCLWIDGLYLLAEAESVERLVITPSERAPIFLPPDIVKVPKCWSLIIDGDSIRNAQTPLDVLQFFICPSLTHLHLQGSARALLGSPHVWGYLQDSGCTLTSLHMGLDKCESITLRDVFSHLSSLERVSFEERALPPPPRTPGGGISLSFEDFFFEGKTLDKPVLDNELLDHLIKDDVLPRLEHLDLSVRCEQSVTDDAIAGMVLQRAKRGLKTLNLHLTNRAFSPAAFLCLDEFKAGGLKVSISAVGCDPFLVGSSSS